MAIHSNNPRTAFVTEYLFLILFSFVIEFIGSLVGGIVLFRVTQTLRFLILLAIFRILNDQSVVISVLLTMPFLFESMMYDRTHFAVWFNAACLGVFTASFTQQLLKLPRVDIFSFLSPYLLLTVAISIIAFVLVTYREELVKYQKEIEGLDSAVANLSNANRAFQTYADNVQFKSAEEERNRITREMHDTVGYALTNVIVMMNAGKVLLKEDPPALMGIFDRLKSQTEMTLGEIRQILYRLREIPQTELKGLQAIHHLVKSFEGATKISISLNMGNLPWSLGQRIDTAMLRLIQEGLTNAFRHGKADEVRVNLWRAPGEIRITIWDNGDGVPTGTNPKAGIGLAGMQERFAAFGGSVTAKNAVDGFMLQAIVPFKMGEIRE